MIAVEPQPIAVERVQKIRDWLSREERNWLVAHVRGVIAGHVAKAGNQALSNPMATLMANDVPLGSNSSMAQAAKYELFLAVLEELTDGEDVSFHTTKLTP